ncbi:helix-turn-helix domain-containing protein [Rickettsia endosymbiont of Halotydeus destructor]|uniref:helix-turn-helix domain-containing protein n=1 Tax=Rickettsia endosymbiont of Halotydeus destructor TaxID=2996754 RepID=UPI003BB22479
MYHNINSYLNMSLATKIKKFLEKKFEEHNLKRKDFVQESKIPYSTVTRIMKATAESGREFNPEIDTILKIADYFNSTMDEVIGREITMQEENN